MRIADIADHHLADHHLAVVISATGNEFQEARKRKINRKAIIKQVTIIAESTKP
jgi:hypothetical protein